MREVSLFEGNGTAEDRRVIIEQVTKAIEDKKNSIETAFRAGGRAHSIASRTRATKTRGRSHRRGTAATKADPKQNDPKAQAH